MSGDVATAFEATADNAAYGTMRKNRLRGSTAIRIKRFVDDLMEHNLAAEHQWQITYITKGIVRDATKIDTTAISQYFTDHAAELDAHHAAMGFTSEKAGIHHNRMRKRQLNEQANKS